MLGGVGKFLKNHKLGAYNKFGWVEKSAEKVRIYLKSAVGRVSSNKNKLKLNWYRDLDVFSSQHYHRGLR